MTNGAKVSRPLCNIFCVEFRDKMKTRKLNDAIAVFFLLFLPKTDAMHSDKDRELLFSYVGRVKCRSRNTKERLQKV